MDTAVYNSVPTDPNALPMQPKVLLGVNDELMKLERKAHNLSDDLTSGRELAST